MKNLIVLLFLMGMALNSSAQRYFYQASNGKWGLKTRSGSIIMSPGYDETMEDVGTLFVNEKIIGVKRGGLWGLVDKTKGTEILAPKYDKMSLFIYGFAIVLKNGKQGFINYSGEEVTPLVYEDVSLFTRHYLAAVKQHGKWGYIDTLGHVKIPLQYDKYSDFDRKGKASVSLNGKSFYINTKGEEVYKYDHVGSFHEGLAAVKMEGPSRSWYGYIDKQGNEIIPLKYSRAQAFRNGIAIVEMNNKVGGIDHKGKTVIPFDYDWIKAFRSSVTMVALDDKVGFINTSGQVVIPVIYDDAVDPSENIVSVQSGDKWGIMDTKGNPKTPVSLDYDKLEECHEGMIRVMKGDKYGFINTSGKLIIPLKYNYAGKFVNDTVIVQAGENWGAVNKKGETLVPFKFKGSAIDAYRSIKNYLKKQ